MAEKSAIVDPRQRMEPAASTTQVPTVSLVHNLKRFSSYSVALTDGNNADTTTSPAIVKAANSEQDHRDSENVVRAALTELLNDASVKNNPDGNRSVQNLLMKTEKEWRRKRRHSVHERGSI